MDTEKDNDVDDVVLVIIGTRLLIHRKYVRRPNISRAQERWKKKTCLAFDFILLLFSFATVEGREH